MPINSQTHHLSYQPYQAFRLCCVNIKVIKRILHNQELNHSVSEFPDVSPQLRWDMLKRIERLLISLLLYK